MSPTHEERHRLLLSRRARLRVDLEALRLRGDELSQEIVALDAQIESLRDSMEAAELLKAKENPNE